MSSRDRAKKRQRHAKPSAPRAIGVNDNAPLVSNDNARTLPIPSREPGVKETPNHRIFRQMQRRALDEAAKAVPRYDPSRLSEDQARRARRAHEQLTSDDPRRQAGGKAVLSEIQSEVERRTEAARRANDNAEITGLEVARGEIVETAGKNEPPGRIRVVTRDAMEMMWRAKSITDLQYQGGLAFRKRYELLDPERGLSPPALDGARKINRGGDEFDRAVQIKKAMDDLLAFQRKVQADDPSRTSGGGRSLIDRVGRRVFVIREVAGKGASIRSLAGGGRERERLAQALSEALDVAVLHFRSGTEDDERRPIKVWRAGDRA